MNVWLIILLVVVIGVYAGISMMSKKKKGGEIKIDFKNRKVTEDLTAFLEHFSKMIFHLFLMIVWLARQIASIFKEFIDWFRNKDEPKGKKRTKEIFKK